MTPFAIDNGPATFVPPGEGAAYWIVGDLITFKLGADRTGGAFAVAETVVPPGGGPPPHVHRREDELFYVLDGDFAFVYGEHVYTGVAGTCMYLHKGIPHTFKNVGSRPGRLLVTAAPCGFESFIPAAGAPCADPSAPVPPVTQADIDRLMAACPAYGLEMRFDHQAASPAPERAAPEREWWVLGEHVRLKLASADTAGQFTVAEITTRPGGRVPVHVHHSTDEFFYVLEGVYEFHIGGRTITAWPGAVVHIPRGTPHGFRNAGPKPARMLDYHTPGGFERFFEEAGVPCSGGGALAPQPATDEDTPDLEKLAALFARHGMELRE